MPLLPSQLTLAGSTTAYTILLRFLSGHSPSPTRFSKSIRAISTLHSALLTILAIYALRQQEWRSPGAPPSNLSSSSKTNIAGNGGYPDDSRNPLITARSEFANSITAAEAGYLVFDTFALTMETRLQGGGKALDKTLLTHHIGIGSALLCLHYYIAQGREAGIYVIVLLLLMNSSTPILNLRWHLRNYARERKTAILAADVAFVLSFFMARIWLIWKVLDMYGRYHGWTAWKAYTVGLRMPCRLGTGAIWTANLAWWIILVSKTLGRNKSMSLTGD